MRSKKAILNITTSLLLQVVIVISSFIIPRYIIKTFGSDINGAVVSISSFLAYIVLLEAGVGGVVKAALYKPLANKNGKQISGIIKATERFFKVIAFLFLIYTCIIAIIFPYITNNLFDYIFLCSLVVIIGTSSFVQYYFGITYSILLQADQRGYISSIFQILTIIANTIISVILINSGFGIHIVLLGSAAIFVIRPILLQIYVKRKYQITSDCQIDNNAIKQRWDGLGHHIAFFLHRNTDVVVLTIFTSVRDVSVYNVYYMVVAGIQKLVNTLTSGVEAAFGNMIAKGEKSSLEKNFRLYEFISFTSTTILFTSAGLLILPFISVYTQGITDVDYYKPLFAYVLVLAEAIYCVRLPYNAIVLAAGHFKQTKNAAYMEAIINIVLSTLFVIFWGMTGVAIATFIAMSFRTIHYAMYLSKNILNRSIFVFVKRVAVSIIAAGITIFFAKVVPIMVINSYIEWVGYAIVITLIALIINILLSLIFYIDEMKRLFSISKKIINRRK
ncbi:lipopolysaccharide biosynthesis protein [Peribacillus frigoritolerans]|uniref:lipopolysaccharide biosynthesis protein n=1 Tax=Peribacillus frigoritolerans TaxID=450367 RepID=UPI003DA18B1A